MIKSILDTNVLLSANLSMSSNPAKALEKATIDDKFLSLAAACEADFLITGDQDLLVLNPFQNTQIITPSDFLAF